jgi:hypothetical protein
VAEDATKSLRPDEVQQVLSRLTWAIHRIGVALGTLNRDLGAYAERTGDSGLLESTRTRNDELLIAMKRLTAAHRTLHPEMTDALDEFPGPLTEADEH